ncbi:MAG: hypothetical protein U0521_24550 [Anaerolineae bacterium]
MSAAASGDNPLIYAYLAHDAAARALSVLMSGSDSADPLLAAVNQSLDGLHADRTPERLLLSGALDGVGIGVQYDSVRSTCGRTSSCTPSTRPKTPTRRSARRPRPDPRSTAIVRRHGRERRDRRALFSSRCSTSRARRWGLSR